VRVPAQLLEARGDEEMQGAAGPTTADPAGRGEDHRAGVRNDAQSVIANQEGLHQRAGGQPAPQG
jgi:hypothetical protein